MGEPWVGRLAKQSMNTPDKVIRSRRVVTDTAVGPAAIHIAGGSITAVAGYDDVPAGCPLVDAGNAVVMPGIVDTHVHVNEPGRTEWEGFSTATRAAAAGGVTTLVDMPLNSVPPTTTVAALASKRSAAAGQCWVDVGFWGGVVPRNTGDLVPLMNAGVLGFKCFLVDSGVAEFGHVGEPELGEALPILADAGRPLLVHAELPGPIDAAMAAQPAQGAQERRRYASYLASRPRAAEDQAIALMIRLCRQTRAPVHIVHHASADAVALLARARDEGLPLTAETCPHYLHFAAEDIPEGATEFKCAPPIREGENRERLWEALASGILDSVVSDHSPCTPALKRLDQGDFHEAWGGISSLQLGLSVMWTEAQARGLSLAHLARWMCQAPARLAGIDSFKGRIMAGHDADLVIWDPEASYRVDPADLHHCHKVTPYHGQELRGRVLTTFVRGMPVYDRGTFAAAPHGRMLARI